MKVTAYHQKYFPKVKELYELNQTTVEIGIALGLPQPTVWCWLKQAGLLRKIGGYTDRLEKQIIDLYISGFSTKQIVQRLSWATYQPVCYVIRKSGKMRKAGVPRNKWRGSGSPNWKGGLTKKNHIIRESSEAGDWKQSVFQRDKWTCQQCERVGGGLHAHHILGFAKYPALRFEVKNGITLCKDCHRILHGIYKKTKVS